MTALKLLGGTLDGARNLCYDRTVGLTLFCSNQIVSLRRHSVFVFKVLVAVTKEVELSELLLHLSS